MQQPFWRQSSFWFYAVAGGCGTVACFFPPTPYAAAFWSGFGLLGLSGLKGLAPRTALALSVAGFMAIAASLALSVPLPAGFIGGSKWLWIAFLAIILAVAGLRIFAQSRLVGGSRQ